MKFKSYVESLNKILAENPESAEYDVIYSHDDEGNNFQKVNYDGTIGYFDGTYYGDFTKLSQLEEEDIYEKPNAICVN